MVSITMEKSFIGENEPRSELKSFSSVGGEKGGRRGVSVNHLNLFLSALAQQTNKLECLLLESLFSPD
jgi:hypothetical protein